MINQHIYSHFNRLVRPPSVAEGEICSREKVMESKRIASLRIHVERAIRRLRVFKSIRPHAVTNLGQICFLDDMVQIACGLANLQKPLIH